VTRACAAAATVATKTVKELARATEDELASRESTPKKAGDGSGTIVFENVRMRYRPTANLALDGVNLSIKHGEKVGVVGRTGSGKSTLLLALFRLFELAVRASHLCTASAPALLARLLPMNDRSACHAIRTHVRVCHRLWHQRGQALS
jgi:ABC-type transport system involved in cytochrome bd biosynthesis fused ATPase/permease subunit